MIDARAPEGVAVTNALLAVKGLSIGIIGSKGRRTPVVDNVSFEIASGGTLGLVGESGSGKSMMCRALVGTLGRHGAELTGGSIRLEGEDLSNASESVWRRVRGRRVAYVPQSSLAGLNPVLSIGKQLTSLTRVAMADDGQSPRARARELLEMVEIPRVGSVMHERPYQLSGGMRQRVVIAGALARSPSLLIADEPTTALDVRVQSKILDLLRRLREQLGMSLMLVSHDLAVVEEVCDSIVVLYAGAVMEAGRQDLIRERARHPYTAGLVAAANMELAGGFEPIPGEAPSVGAWPAGCRFWPRCGHSLQVGDGKPHPSCCEGAQPQPVVIEGRRTACLFAELMIKNAAGAQSVAAQRSEGET